MNKHRTVYYLRCEQINWLAC